MEYPPSTLPSQPPAAAPESQEAAVPSQPAPAPATAAEMSGALATDIAPAPPAATSPAPVTTNGPVKPPAEAPTAEPVAAPEEPVVSSATTAAGAPEAPVADDADNKEADQVVEPSQAATNGTPAEPKPKRKSSTVVPGGRKLNKKKSMPKITHLDAQPGEFYFARLKSYPPWPSIICDEEMLPESLLSTRPVTTKKADGTYNEAYVDGGKKEADRTFPVMFLYTNEFAWIPNTGLAPLNPDECKDVPEKGKSKSLLAAYEVAAENHSLEHFKTMLDEHAAAIQAEIDAKEARENEKAAKADKKKRKSEAKAAEDVDMDDADADAEPKKGSKKRKKEVESDEDEESEKPAKTPKTTKIKLTTNKTPKTEDKKAKDKPAAKSRAEKRKSKVASSDEEMVDAPEPEPEEKPVNPVEALKAREKEVLFLRHKLQKGFLTRDQIPQEAELPQLATYIKKLEGYADLEVGIIRNTKINKVLKGLLKLPTIPHDEEYQFRKRSLELLTQWNKKLGAEPPEVESAADKDGKASPATNGVHEDKADAADEAADDDKKKDKPAAPVEPPVAAAEQPAADKAVVAPAAAAPEPDQPTTEPVAAPVAPEPVTAAPQKPAVLESEPAPATKPEAMVPQVVDQAPEVVDQAPESATAATEASDIVKATD